MRYVFLLAAPLTLGLASLDRAIIPLLYGPEYVDAIPVIAVVAGLAVLKGPLLPVQALLYMTEHQSFLIRFSLLVGGVNLALGLWLIPTGGEKGDRRGMGQRHHAGTRHGWRDRTRRPEVGPVAAAARP